MSKKPKYKLLKGPENTGVIVDSKNKYVTIINEVFVKGDLNPILTSEYGIDGKCMGDEQDLFFVQSSEQNAAIKEYKQRLKEQKAIEKFLTPEKTEELINLFRKK